MRPACAWIARFGGVALVLAATAWGALAMHFLLRFPAAVVWALIAAWLALALAAAWRVWRRHGPRWPLPAWGLVLLGMQLAYWSMPPRQDRDWADDVARRLHPEVQGNRVILHDVRDFDWRSDTDYTVRWDTREYDLDHLASADLALSYWMGPAIAHTLVSFGFDDGSRVVFSLEIRKERGESFSALGGFFRKFEETLVAADERDILRVRTNARGEDMYLYRLAIPRDKLRELFLGYVQRAQALDRAPRFYNTLTSNCTTVVFELARRLDPGLPLDWRLLLSGYFAEYAYDQHALLPGYTFAQLRRAGHVTARARAAGEAADFSTRIRAGMPGELPDSPHER